MGEPIIDGPVALEQPAPQVEGSGGLPSATPSSDIYDGFTLTDAQKAQFKDGKFNGRFANIDEVMVKLKDAEDFKANTIREQKTVETTAVQVEQQSEAQQTAIIDMLPAFQENGMVLTPEMEAQAVAAGVDVRDLKIGAMEFKERVNSAHSIVGGAEEYSAMLAWGKDAMTDSQKNAFDKDITGNMSEYAIKGLYSDYKSAQDKGEVAVNRIEGSPAHVGMKPYADRRELFKDKTYIESAQGKRDTAAINSYRARLRITPNSVLGI